MVKEVWGTFSVKDHLSPQAFLAEVMLYDRLVIPVPPDRAERQRWQENGWEPDRLDQIVERLGDRAFLVEWDAERQANWKTRYDAGNDLAYRTPDWAFEATRTELTDKLPRYVTGVEAVVTYTSVDELTNNLELTETQVNKGEYGTTVAAVIGREFLVPNDPGKPYLDLLEEAAQFSSEPTMKYSRADFWRWQREFLDDKGITDQASIEAAVKDMAEKINREKAFAREHGIQTAIQYAFVVGGVTLGLLNSPLAAVAFAGAFLEVGKYVSGRLGPKDPNVDRAGVALIYDTQKHFGWK